MSADKSERFFSIADIAERWGCSRDIVDDEINNGKLVAVRIGKRWRVRPEDLKAYEDRRASKSTPDTE